MNDKRIIIAEDDKSSGIMLKEALTMEGYEPILTENGTQALKEFNKMPSKVIITDINMPEMDGYELINQFKDAPLKPLILVTTVEVEPHKIIEIMKSGIFDYIIKPINITNLFIKVKKAFELFELKKLKSIVNKERVIKLEKELEWYKWQEKYKKKGDILSDKSIFKNLSSTFSQGRGFGSIIPLVSMITASAEKKSNSYHVEIEPALFEVLESNVLMSDKAVNVFRQLDHLISNELKTEKLSCLQFHSFIKDTIEKNQKYSAIKNQTTILSDPKGNFQQAYLEIHKEYIEKALSEVIINAYKFSKENTSIAVMIEIEHNTLHIIILNLPIKNEDGKSGVAMEYENLIFEPFFRLNNFVQENFDTLDFGMGLSLVDKIIGKHKGSISLSNITDFSDLKSDPVIKVNCSIQLPIFE